MLGLETEWRCVFLHRGLQRSPSGLDASPLGPGLGPLNLLRRMHPLMVIQQKALLRIPSSKQLGAALSSPPGAPSGGDLVPESQVGTRKPKSHNSGTGHPSGDHGTQAVGWQNQAESAAPHSHCRAALPPICLL